MINRIRTEWTVEDLRQSTSRVDIVFKHSDQCDLSAEAATIILDPSAPAAADVCLWVLTVQDDRELSNEVSEALGIPHATPQAIVLKDGVVADVRSHRHISDEWVRGWLA